MFQISLGDTMKPLNPGHVALSLSLARAKSWPDVSWTKRQGATVKGSDGGQDEKRDQFSTVYWNIIGTGSWCVVYFDKI